MNTLAKKLEDDLRNANAARFLNNHQLADALIRGLWSKLQVGTMEIAIMEEAIDRLRNSKD